MEIAAQMKTAYVSLNKVARTCFRVKPMVCDTVK